MPLDLIFQNGSLTTLAPPTSPNILYVNTATGNDSRTITQVQNPSTPWKTISHALSVIGFIPGAGANITIVVASGTYIETLDAFPSGTSGNVFTLQSSTQYGAIIRPGVTSNNPVHITGSYIVFDGFIVDSVNANANTVITDTSVASVTIQNCEIKNTKVGDGTGPGSFQGIQTNGASNITIKNNLIHDIAPSAVNGYNHAIYNSGSNSLIEGNTIYNVGATGIQIFSTVFATDNNVVRNNRIYDYAKTTAGTGGGVTVQGSGNAVYNNLIYQTAFNSQAAGLGSTGSGGFFYNNTFYNLGYEGIQLASSGDTVRNNLLYQISGGAIVVYSGSHTINTNLEDTVDPLFVNPVIGDFHIQSGSPARNTGATIGLVATDFAGTPRPQESIYDIGAYEFIP